MRLGMFDPPEKVPYAQIPDSEIDSPAHRELALKIARESMVLLKNGGVSTAERRCKEDSCRRPISRVRGSVARQLCGNGIPCGHSAGRYSQTIL
jgi:beta-glucosidase-like glycosyl hydrolase